MNRFCHLQLAVLLWIITGISSTAVIDVRRVPSQSSQLKSGDNVVLLCTVTTHTLANVQWYNGTTLLDGNSDGFIITLPYRLNNETWQAVMEIVVLTVYSSGWYYCRPDDLGFGSIQLNIQDAVEDTLLSISYPNYSLYATVPFTLTCISTLPTDNELQVMISWYRNENEVSSSDDTFSINTQYINDTTIQSGLLVTESVPSSDTIYKCTLKTFKQGTNIYVITKSTQSVDIQVSPFLSLSLNSVPNNGPLLDNVYIVTCTGMSSVNGSVSLKWIDSDNSPIQPRQNLIVGETLLGVNGSYTISLTFSEILEDDERLYTCYGVLNINNYPSYDIDNTMSVAVVRPAQITSLIISPLPSNVLDWYEGSDGALICNIQTNRETDNVITEWSSGLLGVITNSSVNYLSTNLYQSILELRSLTAHSDVYYCKASVGGHGIRQDWHYITVESDFPVISVLILSSFDIPAIGTQYTLYCTSERPNNIQNEPTVSWTRGTNAIIEQDLSHSFTQLIDNGTHYISELVFVSVDYSDAGEYVCEVEYSIFGLSHSVKNTDTTLLKIQVVNPVASITTSSEGLECTIQMDAASMSGSFPNVSVLWFLLDNLNNNFIASAVPGIQTTDLSVIECNQLYKTTLIVDDPNIHTDYKSVCCNVNVSIDNANIISSISKTVIDFAQLQEKIPSRPNNVNIRDTGSQWVEISWISEDYDANANNFLIEYQPSNEAETTITNKIYQSMENEYYAVITDLMPAMEYNVQVIVQYGSNVNRSIMRQFATNESVPIGIPLNLTHTFTQNGVTLSWSPPDANERNGAILYYSVSCDPKLIKGNGNETITTMSQRNENQTITVSYTNISLYSLIVDTVYQCSIAAVNSKGIGPSTLLQFSLSMNIIAGGVTENDTLLQWNVVSIVPAVIVGVIGLIIIVSLTVAVCYYRQKLKKIYFPHVCKSLPSLPSDSLTTRGSRWQDDSCNNGNRYVSTGLIDNMFQSNNQRTAHNYIAVDSSQSSTTPLQLELKQMESEL